MPQAAETAGCTLLEWDTEFWGLPIGLVEGDELDRDRLDAVDAWADANGVACLYLLAGSRDPLTAQVAEDGGFRVMDVRIELRRSADGDETVGRLRAARPDDLEALRSIARQSHGVTRFYADPRFPDERCDDLYDRWITRSLEGWAAGVLVGEREGRPSGYVTCHLDEAGAGSIGLIAVDASERRSGAGVELARGAVAWCRERGAERMTVVTQGRNVPALKTFQRAGFLVETVGLWFHKWYER